MALRLKIQVNKLSNFMADLLLLGFTIGECRLDLAEKCISPLTNIICKIFNYARTQKFNQ